jgi:hypothetical protein
MHRIRTKRINENVRNPTSGRQYELSVEYSGSTSMYSFTYTDIATRDKYASTEYRINDIMAAAADAARTVTHAPSRHQMPARRVDESRKPQNKLPQPSFRTFTAQQRDNLKNLMVHIEWQGNNIGYVHKATCEYTDVGVGTYRIAAWRITATECVGWVCVANMPGRYHYIYPTASLLELNARVESTRVY